MLTMISTAVILVLFMALVVVTWNKCFYSQSCYQKLLVRIKELEALIKELKHLDHEFILPDDFRHYSVEQLASYREELQNCYHIRDWLLELHPEYIYLSPKGR